MSLEEAVAAVSERFPFPGYMERDSRSYLTLAEIALRYLPSGAHVLDFGAGPCDKTAVLQVLGFNCVAVDDLRDPWHLEGDNRAKIAAFAEEMGINFLLTDHVTPSTPPGRFDLVMLTDVLEHLHQSPRTLLTELLQHVKPEGYLLITVPNAANVRKRLAIVRGKTNLPPFDQFYWSEGLWRGHIREYTKDDLAALAGYLELQTVELKSVHHMLENVPRYVKTAYQGVTVLFPGWRDSWVLLAQKPPRWRPPSAPLPSKRMTCGTFGGGSLVSMIRGRRRAALAAEASGLSDDWRPITLGGVGQRPVHVRRQDSAHRSPGGYDPTASR